MCLEIVRHRFSPGQQMSERTDLDGKEGRQESEADRRDPGRRLFLREEPPAKPADVAGKFIDDDVVARLPGGKVPVFARAKFGAGN
jgi:hypothetical protein